MGSHYDTPDHAKEAVAREFGEIEDLLRDGLERKAEKMTAEGKNTITAGKQDEHPLRSWKAGNMSLQRLPEDEHGVLRVSVWGIVGYSYCTLRGSPAACATLLRQALMALERIP